MSVISDNKRAHKKIAHYKIPDFHEQTTILILSRCLYEWSIIHPIAGEVGIWEVLDIPMEGLIANCLSSTSWSMCLVTKAFSLTDHILRNGGSVSFITSSFSAICFLRGFQKLSSGLSKGSKSLYCK